MALIQIKRHFDFVEMRKAPFKAFTKTFVLQMRPNDKNETRVGFTVSKKIAKQAVMRNRLRRQMREIVRLSPTLLEKYPSNDLVLIARSEALLCPYKQLAEDFEYLLTHFHQMDDEKNSD